MNNVHVRVVPPELRAVGNYVSRNNVYSPAGDLLGQLDGGSELKASAAQVAALQRGAVPMANAAASTASLVSAGASLVSAGASVLTLGVCVAGFRRMGQALDRIEDSLEEISAKLDQMDKKLDRIDQKLDVVLELVGVIDQKVDTLIDLNIEQAQALGRLHRLVMSFETAKVQAAFKALEIHIRLPPTDERNQEIRQQADTLAAYRVWLHGQREDLGSVEGSIPARAEILHVEVLLAVAEARARCIAGSASYAVMTLQDMLAEVRGEVQAMVESASTQGLSALVPRAASLRRETYVLNEEHEELAEFLSAYCCIESPSDFDRRWHRGTLRSVGGTLGSSSPTSAILAALPLVTAGLGVKQLDYVKKGKRTEPTRMKAIISKLSASELLAPAVEGDDDRRRYRSLPELISAMNEHSPPKLWDPIWQWGSQGNPLTKKQHHHAAAAALTEFEKVRSKASIRAGLRSTETGQQAASMPDAPTGVDHRSIVEALAWLKEASVEETSLEMLDAMRAGYDGDVEHANIAGIIAAHGFGRSVESALAVCTAIELGGEPARALLEATESPQAPALVISTDPDIQEGEDVSSRPSP